MLKEIITINKGYKIIEQTTTVDALLAYRILSTKKQFKYTSAEYLANTKQVALKRHTFVCPNCNAYRPAYKHFVYDYNLPKRMSPSRARQWCYEYRTLLDMDNETFDLYEPIDDLKGVECPVCGQKSSTSNLTEDILVEYNKGVIKVTCTLDRIFDVINIDWAPTVEVVALPLVESVTFNVKKGTTFFELYDSNGKRLAIRDVTNMLPASKQVSKMIRLINSNVHVKRKLIEYFEKAWKGPIPFSINELDFSKANLITAYVGYTNVSFYNNILGDVSEPLISELYKATRKKLHYINNCVSVVETSSMPHSKTIKATIYSNLHFLFYVKEIELLWKLFQYDHNLLSSFLTSETAHANLMTLYAYPGIVEFYADFASIKSPLELKNMLITSGKKAYLYGVYYSAYSERYKREAQKRWKNFKEVLDEAYYSLNYTRQLEPIFATLPKEEESNRFSEQCINGYKFIALKSRYDFITAGKQLKNCLSTCGFRNPVIGVMKYGRYVAAIEVCVAEMLVEQAHLAENKSIDADQCVFAAFKKWCKKNGVREECDYVYPF